MEQAQGPGMPCGELDRAAFERVWHRVMPEDRPDCPFTLIGNEELTPAAPAPHRQEARLPPPPCLAETGAAELPRLETLLQQTADLFRIYRALARRSGGTLGILAREKRRQARQLATAHFLISGKSHTISPTPAPRQGSFALSLRDCFHAEQSLSGALLHAGRASGDPSLSELYRTMSVECRRHAQQVWGLIERL
ncbi:MAG: hypothetical protein PUC36_02640 [Clostridiales bacterium]|nr:hypothetical protein [Clostridiales bacterium]